MSLLREMIREEWRTHTTLFGDKRFAGFPLLMFAMTAIMFSQLPLLGVSPNEVTYGLHLLLLFFGLNVGVVGFITESGVRNVLGDVSLLLYSSRTLPLSRREIVGTFLLKDLLYYTGLFVVPVVAASYLYAVPAHPLLLSGTYMLSFLIGMVVTFFTAVLYLRRPAYATAPVVGVIGAVVLTHGGALNPGYLLYQTPSLIGFVLVLGGLLALTGASMLLFTHPDRSRKRVVGERFSMLSARFGTLPAKNLLDLQRSGGGFGKLIFSFGILFAVFWFLTDTFTIDYLQVSPILSFAVLLGMASLSVYNWLTQFDAESQYLHLPLTRSDLIQGKLTSFGVITTPILVIGLSGIGVLFGVPADQFLHAIGIAGVTSLYIVAITVRITGLQPNEMLFDIVRFGRFTIAATAVFVPYFISALLYPRAPVILSAVLIVMDVLLALISLRLLAAHLPAGLYGIARPFAGE